MRGVLVAGARVGLQLQCARWSCCKGLVFCKSGLQMQVALQLQVFRLWNIFLRVLQNVLQYSCKCRDEIDANLFCFLHIWLGAVATCVVATAPLL